MTLNAVAEHSRPAAVRRPLAVLSSALTLYLPLVVVAAVFLGPFLWVLAASFESNSDFVSSGELIPHSWILANYRAVFTQIPLARMIANGLFIAVLATAGGILASALGAFALAKLPFRGRHVLFGATLATMMIPGAVTLIPLYTIIHSIGLVNSPWALILPNWTGSAFAVFFFRQHMRSIPHELFDAATIDGCGYAGILFRIYLPLLTGAISVLALLNFLTFWNDLLGPLIYLTSPQKMTVPVGLTYFQGQYLTDYPVVLAGTVISLVPTTVMFIIFNRRIRSGIALTGLK